MGEHRGDSSGIVDVGDVFVVPQLLHDEMLSDAQLAVVASRPCTRTSRPRVAALPVSPLSIAERALDRVFELNPRVRPFHPSVGIIRCCAWLVVAAMARVRKEPWGIVQPDAHTDLLPERLGVKYCFATWSYHANELLGRGGKLVQVGTRASRFPREHWESTLGVRQFWAEECLRDPAAALDGIVAHLKRVGVRGFIFQRHEHRVGRTRLGGMRRGRRSRGGWSRPFFLELVRRLGREIGIWGGDVTEVAPPLGPEGGRVTVAVAGVLPWATLEAALGSNFGQGVARRFHLSLGETRGSFRGSPGLSR